jgi:cell division protein FtsB
MLERQMQEMRDLPERVTSLESHVLQLRQEMRDEFSATRAEFRSELAVAVTTLSKAIADTNTHMRTLHEEAISRIARMGEGRQTRKKR